MTNRFTVLLFVVALVAAAPAQASAASAAGEPATIALSSSCTVSQQCSNGGSVSCSGTPGTCTSGSDWVQCDGNRVYCPRPCEPFCEPCEAAVFCQSGSYISCDSSQTSLYHYCEEGSDYVYCEGAGTLTCEECYPAIWCHIP